MNAAYHLGCPVWASEHWMGSLYTRHARRDEWLRQYASVFNCVEGNSTFYGLPARETVLRWAGEVTADFRFVLKFPRTITHDKRLLKAEVETGRFLDVLRLLNERHCLGPSLLQLPSGFSGYHINDLAVYLRNLPREFPYAVEVRNLDYFSHGTGERELNQLLAELHVDRVIFDSRPLFSAPAETKEEEIAQTRKPRLPVEYTITAAHPIIRLIGRDDTRRVHPWLADWGRIVSKWMLGGLRPYVFTHTPDDRFAPKLAREFHCELLHYTELVPELPPWPGESEKKPERQLNLFS
jgi:uncharacterized protein YecE (DUF72 family)